MIGLGAFLGHVYLKASLCMRREMSNLKGPMMSQVTAALGALREFMSFPFLLYHLSEHPCSVYPRLWRSVLFP